MCRAGPEVRYDASIDLLWEGRVRDTASFLVNRLLLPLALVIGIGCAAADTEPAASGSGTGARNTGAAGATGGKGGVGGAGGAGASGANGGEAGHGGVGKGGAGAGGAGGTGGQSCAVDQKVCNGQCVDVGDPAYGCTPMGCDPCAIQNVSATCNGGQCTLSSCDPGFANCDGNAANGCEIDTMTSVISCGACGLICNFPNAD